MGALLFLCIWEFRRYRASDEDSTALAYPGARLLRRELTAILGIIILFGLAFKPESLTNTQDLLWYGGCMILTMVVILFAVYDLREASRAALEAQREFQRRAADHFEGILEESRQASQESARQPDRQPDRKSNRSRG